MYVIILFMQGSWRLWPNALTKPLHLTFAQLPVASYPLLPAILYLAVVVLLLITCVAGGEGETTEKIYDKVGEGTDPIGEQKGALPGAETGDNG